MKEKMTMAKYIKNIPSEEIFSLTDQVEYLPGQVVSRTIAQNDAQSLTIFAFDKDEEISSHSSHGDALITVLDGEGRVTIDGKQYILHRGESILMPAGKPHAAPLRFARLLANRSPMLANRSPVFTATQSFLYTHERW